MPEKVIKGLPASDGIAIGSVFCYIPAKLEIPVCAAGSVDEEMDRFVSARACARVELQGLYDAIEKRAGKEEALDFRSPPGNVERPCARRERSMNLLRSVKLPSRHWSKLRRNLPSSWQSWVMNYSRRVRWM